jgi:benzoate transport
MSGSERSGNTQEQGWTRFRATIIAICVLINMLDGMDVMVIAYVAPALSRDWNIGFELLGAIFSAGLAGMMIGSIVVAPFADRVGRRPVILAALVMMTLGMVGTGLAKGLAVFLVCRGLAGIGIGALLASIATMVAEYAPTRSRAFAMGMFQSSYQIGAILTGLVSLWSIPTLGWQATLVGAGLVSALALPLVWFVLPESLHFLEHSQHQGALEKSNALRLRLGQPEYTALPPKPSSDKRTLVITGLFREGLLLPSLLLWLSIFMAFAVLYFVTNWIPRLSTEAGLSIEKAIWAGMVFNAGGFIGALSIGWLADRLQMGQLIRSFLVIGGVLLVLFGLPMPLPATLLVAALIGFTLQGGFSGFYALTASLYDPEVRSTGIGWAIGIGRGGSVLGPFVGGLLLVQELPLWLVFACFAAAMALAGVLAALVRRKAIPAAV